MLEINYFTEMILSRPLSFGLVSWIATAIYLWWEDKNDRCAKELKEELKRAIVLQNSDYEPLPNQKPTPPLSKWIYEGGNKNDIIDGLRKKLADTETRYITLQEHLVVLERKSKQSVDYENINKIAKLESQIRSLNRKLTKEELKFEDVYQDNEIFSKEGQDWFRECAMRDFEEFRKERRERNSEENMREYRYKKFVK